MNDFDKEMRKRRQVRKQRSEGTLKSSYTDEAVEVAKRRKMIERANANRAQAWNAALTKQRFQQQEAQAYRDRVRTWERDITDQAGESEKQLTALADVRTRVADLEDKIAKSMGYAAISGTYDRVTLEKELADLLSPYGGRDGLEKQYGEAQRASQIAKMNVDGMPLVQAGNWASEYYDKDFDKLTGVDSSVMDNTYRWINDERFRADVTKYGRMAASPAGLMAEQNRQTGNAWLKENGAPDFAALSAANYDRMTDEERALYNYHYAKGGSEQANAYLKLIAGDLNRRKAEEEFQKIKGKTGAELAAGIGIGLDQFARGASGLTDDLQAPSVAQYKGQMIREDLKDDGIPLWYNFKDNKWENQILGSSTGQIAYDAITTTANMAPSVLASSALTMLGMPGAATWVGTGAMGVSAAGNARQEALGMGYSDAQAISYGLMVGVAEASMERLLGGISALGGQGLKRFAGGKFVDFLDNLDNAFLRVSAEVGESMLSEGVEEYLQEIIDPMLRNVALGEDNDLSLYSPEALYSGLLGALTGGILEGPTAIANDGRRLREAYTPEMESKLLEAALSEDEDSAPYALARRYMEKWNGPLSGQQLGKLAKTYSRHTSENLMDGYRQEAEERLAALEIEDGAVVAAIAKTMTGDKLNRRERRALEHSPEGQKVLQDMQEQEKAEPTQEGPLPKKPEQAADPAAEQAGGTVWDTLDEVGAMSDNASNAADNTTAALDNADNTTESVAEPVAKPVEADDGDFTASESGRAEFDGKPVDIKGIKDTRGDMTLELEDGRTVKASEVLYATEGEALVYEAVASLGAPADIGNILVKNYRDGAEDVEAEDYAAGMALAFNHGRYNLPQQQMTDNPYIAKLTEVQRNSAYVLGQRFGGKQVASQQAIARRARFGQRFKQMGQPLTGRVHYDGDVRTLNARQRASVAALEKVAQALGVQVHLFESLVDENGVRQGENGWYNTKTGDIGIDIHAGISGEDTMLFTAAHELTHFIKQWSPAKFKVLANFLMEQYGEKGISVEELVEQQQAKALRGGRELSFDEAFEELVADSMETMLADGNVLEKLTKLGKQDRTLLEKLRDGLQELIQKIREVYKGLKPDSREGRYVAEMKDSLERLQELFTEALEDAGQNFQAAEQTEAAASSQQEAAAESDLEEFDIPETDWSDFDEDSVQFSRRDNEKTAREGGVKYSLRVKFTDGSIEELEDARDVSDSKMLEYLRAAKAGKLLDKTYIPVRRDTPAVLINTLEQVNESVKNLSMVMQVAKARQAMSDDLAIRRKQKYGANVRKHSLSPEQIIQIVKNLDDPNTIIYQTERHDKYGNPLPNNVSVFVTYADGDAEGVAVIEFEGSIDPAFVGREHGETDYHIVVTLFRPDASRDGVPFDYAEELLSNPDNYELKIERRPLARGATRENHPNTLGELPSNNKLPHRGGSVNTKFSLRQPVEETKTLIAMHNLTEDKLVKAVELGGFPMPSIAVTRADIPHTNFGEITLVMDKGTVDPKADRRNDVFSADAWTPTFPRTEYEANSEVEDRVRRTLQELERRIAPQFQGNLRRVMYGLEDLLNSYDGEENLIAHVLDNDGLKAVYLESQGKHIDEVQVEQEVPKRYNQAAKEKYEAIIAALGTRDPAEIGTMPLKDIRNNHGAELEKIIPGISKTSLRLSRFMQQTIDYLMDDGSGPEMEMVVDQNATRRAMEDALDQEGYEAWVRELFSGIEGDKGIYNGKERFTPGGRSRSFQQTHLPVTLDNIVKAMAAQNGGNTKNVAGFNGVKTLRAGTAQRFKSIQGMHDLEGRLQNLTEEEQTALTDGLQSRLYDLIDEIDQEAGRKGTSNNLIRFDQIGQIITEASETGRYNVADIQTVFQENHQTISDELALKVKELLFDVSQMPVNLFEAKPRRAVRFDEVRAAVVPADTSEDLKRKLAEQGVPVIEYERDNTDDRLQKVNSVEGVKFSDRDPAKVKLNQALQKENAAQAKEIEYLRELVRLQGQVTNGTKFTRSSVRSLAQQLMKDAGAKGNYLELAEMLNGIYESIATQDDPLGMSWGEVEGRIDEAARWLVEHIEVKQDRGEYANDILRDLRGRKISLNDGQRAEVEGRYGSYDTFRKSMFGSVIISKDGTPLDMVWQELASQYPGTFDADVGDADMPLKLAEIVEGLREMDLAAMEFEMQRDGLLEELRQNVYDGYWRVSTLKTVADQWKDRMDQADATGRAKLEKQAASYQKQIDELVRVKNNAMENLKKARQERDKANRLRIDSVRELRESKKKAVETLRKSYKDARKKSVEGRNKTAMRHKIQRVVKELNDLLLKPDKKHHVPEGLRKVVAEALEMVNMDPADTEARVARYDELIAKETDQAKIDAYEITKQNILDRAENVKAKLDHLRAAYEEIKNSADPEIANAYDSNISDCLLELSGTIGDTPLKNMSMEQLSDVYDMYTMVLTTIRDSNKQLTDALNAGHRESADAAEREITGNGKRNRLGIELIEQLRKFGINNLKPVYFFEYLNSKTFRKLYQGLMQGQSQFGRNMAEARDFRQEQVKKYGAKNWDKEKTWTFRAASGDKFSLNLEQIMSLYAYSKRDQAREHIRKGGIVIDPETKIREVVELAEGKFKVKLKGKSTDATAYNIDDVTLDEIIGKLTAKQRAYVDAMQDYLSDTMGTKGNEVSMKLYGIKLFKEKHYFPLRSAQEYSVRAKEQAEQTARLKNAGFTKSTKPHANNPILLSEFSSAWGDHVQDMSQYHAMTLPIEDLYRVYNYSRTGDGVERTRALVAAIKNAFGPQATGYIDQFMKDMNGKKFLDSTGEFQSKLVSRFKKGAVFMSASVLFQQSSSVARALAEIDAKYLSPVSYVESLTVYPRQLLGLVNKNASRSHDKLWAELKEYAPVAVIKEMGYFDMNMGKSGRDYLNAEEYSGFKEKLVGMWKDSSYRDEVLSRGPALADELAWCDIWRAVKREQHAKHPKLRVSSKEFLELCGQRFTEVIDKTQVYDSVLSRSANMRSGSELMKMATNFMAEPTINANMLANALLEGKRRHKGKAVRIVGSIIAANIINAALAALVYAARDDDEDKEYWEKYLGHLTGEVIDSMNPLTYIPIVQDILSVCAGWDVERADMAVVSDLVNAFKKLSSDEATTWEKTRDMLGATSQLLNLPVKNLLRDGEALWRVVNDAFDGQSSTATGIGYAVRAELPEWIPGGGVVSNEDQLYEAILSGDKAHEERVRQRYKDKDGNIDEGKITNARRKALRKNDSRIHEAAVYLNEDEFLGYYALIEEIVGEGFFHKDDVVSAIQTEANDLLSDEEKEAAEPKHKSAFKAEHFAIAASRGDSEMMNKIKADFILTAQSNGKTEVEAEASAVSTIRGAVKEAYLETGTVSEEQAEKALMGWCDATEKEAADAVNEWTFEKQNGYPLSELEDVFVGGEITADKAEGFLVSGGGYARTEAQSKVLQWQCEVDTGIRYDDVQQLYVGGEMTADKAKELRVKYGESSIEDARKTVLKWDCEKDNGVKYSDIDVAYLSGDITEKTAIDWLVKYGEKGRDKAELTVQAYRWRNEHTEYKDLSETAIDRYIDHCEGAGISIPDFYEVNKRVSEIKEAGGTQKENVVRYIRSLPLSRSQKWAMWYAVKTKGWVDNVSF